MGAARRAGLRWVATLALAATAASVGGIPPQSPMPPPIAPPRPLPFHNQHVHPSHPLRHTGRRQLSGGGAGHMDAAAAQTEPDQFERRSSGERTPWRARRSPFVPSKIAVNDSTRPAVVNAVNAAGSEGLSAGGTHVPQAAQGRRAQDEQGVPWSSTSTTTSTMTTWTLLGCPALATCLNSTACAACLAALNHAFVTHADAFHGPFYRTMLNTRACSPNMTTPGTLRNSLYELQFSNCITEGALSVGACGMGQVDCFEDSNCRRCTRMLLVELPLSSVLTKSAVLASAPCMATRQSLLKGLASCLPFPYCSFFKTRCNSDEPCSDCWGLVRGNEGAAAATRCSNGVAATKLDSVMAYCYESNPSACDYWQVRCDGASGCSTCFEAIQRGGSAEGVATAFASPACAVAVTSAASVSLLQVLAVECSGVTGCLQQAVGCVLESALCGPCLLGSAPPSDQEQCPAITRGYDLDVACQPCPQILHTINVIVLATTAVGVVSVLGCLAVVLAILAHGRDRASMRERIVLGMVVANAVYSSANVIPLNMLHTGADCGKLALSFDTIRFGRAWWFCGKYGLVCFEVFILGASLWASTVGSASISTRTEAVLHALCAAGATAAFLVFYIRCGEINAGGYNAHTLDIALTGTYARGSPTDDMDDDSPQTIASHTFESSRDEYDDLVRSMLLAWDAVVGLAILLWMALRVRHHRTVRAYTEELDASRRQEADDEWADTRRSEWRAERRLVQARQAAFEEIAAPLELYVAVFVLFGIPAFVMTSPFCAEQSSVDAKGLAKSIGSAAGFTYGTCDVWCELALSFRSLATLAVYILPRERRRELLAVRATWRRFGERAHGWVLLGWSRDEVHEAQVIRLDSLATSQAGDDPVQISKDPDTDPSAIIPADEVRMHRKIGEGGFGEVWEASWMSSDGPMQVAVKLLFTLITDEEGDLVNPTAEEDFWKECSALRGLDNPHVVKFYGHGVMEQRDSRFLVTELMPVGSLEGRLHDAHFEFSWRTRVLISLQVSLGMEYLHGRRVLHRDLKSANVLLTQQWRAKVCDFGLARTVRPASGHVLLYSPFTGVCRKVRATGKPEAYGTMREDKGDVLPAVTVGVLDAAGSLTKAAGTMEWMAPEAFRGDKAYGPPSDVYSFGMLLFEVVTRTTPWSHLTATEHLPKFSELNDALQKGARPVIDPTVAADHSDFVAIVHACWAGDPADRPSFVQVSPQLAECLRACPT